VGTGAGVGLGLGAGLGAGDDVGKGAGFGPRLPMECAKEGKTKSPIKIYLRDITLIIMEHCVIFNTMFILVNN
jgi:hypothetical protein